MRRVTTTDLQRMRDRGEPIAMVTAYDYPMAKLVDEAEIPAILVGDSLGMVVLGYDSTLPVTLDDMIHHAKAVMRGAQRAHVVVDLPFGSYQTGWQDAMRAATRVLSETGAGAVKLEGGVRVAETVRRLVEAGIPVMGHIGLTPQSIHTMGGFKVQGKLAEHGRKLVQAAKSLAHAGCYSIVLEGVPVRVAEMVTESIDIPTIGIGAGMHTDGQVLVYHDLLGIEDRFVPKFVRRYADIKGASVDAVRAYAADVRSGAFPSHDEAYHMDDEQAAALEG